MPSPGLPGCHAGRPAAQARRAFGRLILPSRRDTRPALYVLGSGKRTRRRITHAQSWQAARRRPVSDCS